jgi:hypothetical protein
MLGCPCNVMVHYTEGSGMSKVGECTFDGRQFNVYICMVPVHFTESNRMSMVGECTVHELDTGMSILV